MENWIPTQSDLNQMMHMAEFRIGRLPTGELFQVIEINGYDCSCCVLCSAGECRVKKGLTFDCRELSPEGACAYFYMRCPEDEYDSEELIGGLSTGEPVIYAIDFDGTIVENTYPGIGKLRPEAHSFITNLKSNGDKWILYTMREGKSLEEALAFLLQYGLRPDAVNDNLPELCERFGNNPRKIFANVYIDDHNAGGLKFCEAVSEQGEVK